MNKHLSTHEILKKIEEKSKEIEENNRLLRRWAEMRADPVKRY